MVFKYYKNHNLNKLIKKGKKMRLNMLGESFCIIDIILVRWSRTTRLFPRDYETERDFCFCLSLILHSACI